MKTKITQSAPTVISPHIALVSALVEPMVVSIRFPVDVMSIQKKLNPCGCDPASLVDLGSFCKKFRDESFSIFFCAQLGFGFSAVLGAGGCFGGNTTLILLG